MMLWYIQVLIMRQLIPWPLPEVKVADSNTSTCAEEKHLPGTAALWSSGFPRAVTTWLQIML